MVKKTNKRIPKSQPRRSVVAALGSFGHSLWPQGRSLGGALWAPFAGLQERMTQAASRADPAIAARRLFFVTLALMGLGFLIQVSHASTTYSHEAFQKLLVSQAELRLGALGVLLGAYFMGPTRLRRFLPHLVVVLGLALMAVYFKPLSDWRNGSRRWLDLSLLGLPIKFQPSELARVVIVLWIADRCVRLGEGVQDLRRGVMPMLSVVFGFCLLILFEKDLGGSMLFLMCAISTIWVGGGKLLALGTALLLPLVSAVAAGYHFVPYMHDRIEMFMGRVENDQVNSTMAALSSGGLSGAGFTQGLYRNDGVPYLESDYVFALIGEELGVLGMWLVLALLMAFLWYSVRLVLSLRGGFNALAAFGLLLAVSLQAMLHVQVVSGLAPPKGMTLPFLSHGGTSLIVSALSVGLALGAARNTQEDS